MGKFFYVFLILLGGSAILLGEHSLLTLVYLFAGALLAGKVWEKKILQGLEIQRSFTPWVFLGEKTRIKLTLTNRSLLPAAWLQLRESLPVEMHTSGPFQQVLHLGAKSGVELEYTLDCRRRGIYTLGPLDVYSGDVLGVARIQQLTIAPSRLVVYPRIVPLASVKIPSQAPLGALRHNRPILEDPSRASGKRDYVSGDSLRRIDWKASASSGRLQVKLFEPSIALETQIFLNLNALEYELKTRYFAGELAIVTAASLANWIVSRRQAVGLVTNGADPLALEEQPVNGQNGGQPLHFFPQFLPPRRGRGHLLHLLETLARVQMAETMPLSALIRRQIGSLAWGSTLIVLTGRFDDELFDSLFYARRSGMDALLVQIGQAANYGDTRRRAAYFGFPIFQILDEADLDIWRQGSARN